ncbi:YycC family protein [Paenibacillus sp. TAB 01]|uniref:YycC family protein n=1 Tax=Paenibacillus sp. TAB 01 TaxID=3368988 RepID=UPI00375263D0
MKPLQISPETAQKLAKQLNVPLEHLMHMPQHILLQKLAELAKSSSDNKASEADGGPKQES